MAFGPATRHVGEYRQHRQLIIVVPKNERIVEKQDQAKDNNN
jgi:hypothetical protein